MSVCALSCSIFFILTLGNVFRVYVNLRVYLFVFIFIGCLFIPRYCSLQAYHFVLYVAALVSLSCTLVLALFTMVLYRIRLARLKSCRVKKLRLVSKKKN